MPDEMTQRPNTWRTALSLGARLAIIAFAFVALVTLFLTQMGVLFSVPGFAGLAISSCLALIFAWKAKERIVKRVLYVVFSFTILCPVAAFLILLTVINPFLDDGPFTGTVRSVCPSGIPLQSFAINLGRTLEVFAPREGDKAPTVLLREIDKSVAWCVLATGHESSTVYRIDFSSFLEKGFSKKVTVYGTVEWTYGHEKMTWKIEVDDSYAYWYAW